MAVGSFWVGKAWGRERRAVLAGRSGCLWMPLESESRAWPMGSVLTLSKAGP